MRSNVCFLLPAILLFVCCGMAYAENLPEIKAVSGLELERYLGKWFEIARITHRFEKGCVGATAEYSLLPDGKIKVVNSCRMGALDGKFKQAVAKAWLPDKKVTSKLKVRFFWPFTGNYWVISLGSDYEYAVVSEPNRKYLWILSRTPQMDKELYNRLIGWLKEQGYDISKIDKVLQPEK